MSRFNIFKTVKNKATDPLGRKQHIVKDMKEIHYHKNQDGSLDTTPRILLVFPVFSHVLPEAFASFMHLALHSARWLPQYKFDVMLCERELLHSAMNRAAEVCIKNPWYVGMVAFDDDCIIPANAVVRFAAHYEHGHQIIAGYGFMRRYPHTTTVGTLLEGGPTIFHEPGVIQTGEQRGFKWLDDCDELKGQADEHGLLQVDFCGMPAMFISRKVLHDMKPPHFMHEDKTGAVTTHDIYFCNKARDMGHKVMVDMTLECGHIGPPPVITEQTRKWARVAVETKEASSGSNGKVAQGASGRDGDNSQRDRGEEQAGVRASIGGAD